MLGTPPHRYTVQSHGFTRLVPTYSAHTHTCMYWAKSPEDPPPLGWLANGYNFILVEPFHRKPVQGLVGTVRRDRWSEEPTSTIPLSPYPCSPDLQSPENRPQCVRLEVRGGHLEIKGPT